ncbi:MAG: HNH endonuclease [Clostridiaceae bacterium]
MTKKDRIAVWEKYGHCCAYCGKAIEFKDMRVDHIVPKRNGGTEYNPACRRCNHYKRAHSLETFRQMLKTLHERVRQIYICKVAEDYGIIKVEPWGGVFYFEKVEAKGNV